jgi:predicted RNA-binding protein YlqC (UPF0109 family)
MAQNHGADPGKVIARMGNQIGALYTELCTAMEVIETLEEQNEILRKQQKSNN